MKKTLLAFLGLAFLCVMVADASACYLHGNNKWALHYAGPHNSQVNTCAFTMMDCRESPVGELVSQGPCGPGRYDVYVLALNVVNVAGTRYGLCCDPPTGCFWFYGWTSCSDFEIPTPGWPACGEGNAQTWATGQGPGNLTLGILDVYVYPGCGCCLCACDDPRVGYGEWCDDSSPEPWCCKTSRDNVLPPPHCGRCPAAFGCVCFGVPGYNPCLQIPVEQKSWGALKSLYQ
jgi:hypothetical protein